MIRWLVWLLTLLAPVTATSPAVRGPTLLPDPPPAAPATDTDRIDTWDGGCTYTRIEGTVVTAEHCLPAHADELGWQWAGDRAWLGPEPVWADPAAIPRGATVWAVGFPGLHGRTTFALAVLQVQQVGTFGAPVAVLMTMGEGVACTQGASGMIGWVAINGVARPIGPLSVFSTDPAVTALPAGQYVCGFAIG